MSEQTFGTQPIRRRIPLAAAIVASLAAGFVLTVLSAWACALWSPVSAPSAAAQRTLTFTDSDIRGQHPFVISRRGFGLRQNRTTWFVAQPAAPVATSAMQTAPPNAAASAPPNSIIIATGTRAWHQMLIEDQRSGWPFPALRACRIRGTLDQGPDGQPLIRPGLIGSGIADAEQRLPGLLRTQSGRSLPLQPIWWGFLGNIVLYTLLVSIAFAGRAELRRHLRRRRSQCLDCGYPVAGTTRCPECGRETILAAVPKEVPA